MKLASSSVLFRTQTKNGEKRSRKYIYFIKIQARFELKTHHYHSNIVETHLEKKQNIN